MQTFLPYPEYIDCAKVLDNKRLGNQFYNEGMIILAGNHKWRNHPAVKMWKPWKFQLCIYLLTLAKELKERGFYYREHIEHVNNLFNQLKPTAPPNWLGIHELHTSHRANLLRKDPVHYGKFGWIEQPAEKYYWPV